MIMGSASSPLLLEHVINGNRWTDFGASADFEPNTRNCTPSALVDGKRSNSLSSTHPEPEPLQSSRTDSSMPPNRHRQYRGTDLTPPHVEVTVQDSTPSDRHALPDSSRPSTLSPRRESVHPKLKAIISSPPELREHSPTTSSGPLAPSTPSAHREFKGSSSHKHFARRERRLPNCPRPHSSRPSSHRETRGLGASRASAHSQIRAPEPSKSVDSAALRDGAPGASESAWETPPSGSKVRKVYRRLLSHPGDELERFRSSLFFLGLDQSTRVRMAFSWILFFLFTALVPALTTFYVSCENCDDEHSHPFQKLVDLSESVLAAVSFFCLWSILRKFGLRKVLLLDRICGDSMDVRHDYESELHNAFKLLLLIVFPGLLLVTVHQAWWYTYVSVELPFLPPHSAYRIILCIASITSWLYKSTVFLFVCVLFKLMCSLQIFRLQGYIKLLEETSEVEIILQEHIRIRDQLLMISHRFRVFVVVSMLTITCSQLISLFFISDSKNRVNFFRVGDLVVCSFVQLSGLGICLHGAAKITHRAQRIMSIVTQWHALVTCSPYNMLASAYDLSASTPSLGPAHRYLYNPTTGDPEASINVCRRPPGIHELNLHDPEEFQKRQALVNYLQFSNAVSYLQYSNAGISLYGFVLDRALLFGLFGIELPLMLFILGKQLVT